MLYFFFLFIIFSDLGLRQPRLEGDEYLSIVDEFMEAVFTRWPKAIVQVVFCQIMIHNWLYDNLDRDYQ